MWLQIYVYTDATVEPSMVGELAEYEEAVECCRELVSLDGYPRAEVWSADGECVYGTGQTRGATWELDRSYALREEGLAPGASARSTSAEHENGAHVAPGRNAGNGHTGGSHAGNGHAVDGDAVDGQDPNGRDADGRAGDGHDRNGHDRNGSDGDGHDGLGHGHDEPPASLRFLGGQPKASERWFGL